jgi:prefoldin subunit 5
MARFQTELENLQNQQKEAVERLQTLDADSTKLRELILKLQGAIEVLQALDEREQQPQAASEVDIPPASSPDFEANASK